MGALRNKTTRVFIGVKQGKEKSKLQFFLCLRGAIKVKFFSTSCFWGFVLLFAGYINWPDCVCFCGGGLGVALRTFSEAP